MNQQTGTPSQEVALPLSNGVINPVSLAPVENRLATLALISLGGLAPVPTAQLKKPSAQLIGGGEAVNTIAAVASLPSAVLMPLSDEADAPSRVKPESAANLPLAAIRLPEPTLEAGASSGPWFNAAGNILPQSIPEPHVLHLGFLVVFMMAIRSRGSFAWSGFSDRSGS